ncbi:MAG: bifunctional 3-deoxy-7-phosphoheptulonate synthase/chorismate mutase type II [Alistipes sp.]
MEIAKLTFKGVDCTQPLLIAGPCSAESRKQVLTTAAGLSAHGIRIFRAGIWKPRTKPGSFEGVGSKGLAWLNEVQKELGMLVATEVATPLHVAEALRAGLDLLWIGARTVTNPFAMQELSDVLRGVDIPILVKNPVNPDLELWCGAIERLANAGVQHIGVIHRGFSSYEQKIYKNTPLWHIPIELRRRFPEMTLLCDPSHIGGSRALVAPISQQALDLNFDGLMIESHCAPDTARSDAAQQLTPEALWAIIELLVVRDKGQTTEDINILRRQIDQIDEQFLALLGRRMQISRQIGTYKKEHNISILQSARYNEILDKRSEMGKLLDLTPDFVKEIMKAVHEESVKVQMQIMGDSD